MTPYTKSALVYDALFRRKDYRRASRSLAKTVKQFAPTAGSLLDVGCGTGRHLEILRHRFRVEGLDLSREMLAVARQRCPGIRLHHGTFVNFELRRQFDVVTCLFGSIGYAKTLRNLRKAVQCMARHLSPDGVLIIEPWIAPTHFVSGRLVFDQVDEPELKVGRLYITKRRQAVSIFDSHYVVATPAGVAHFTERQELGLFTDRQYRTAFRAAGLEVVATTPDLMGYGLYVCRPAAIRRMDTTRPRPS